MSGPLTEQTEAIYRAQLGKETTTFGNRAMAEAFATIDAMREKRAVENEANDLLIAELRTDVCRLELQIAELETERDAMKPVVEAVRDSIAGCIGSEGRLRRAYGRYLAATKDNDESSPSD